MIRRSVWLALVVCLLLLSERSISAQGIFATLTGVVSDQAGGVVPKAKITLRDSTSGSTRDTVTNGEGYYTFASVPVGTYVMSVEAQGFRHYEASDISLGGGERRNVNVQLQIGTASETVQVSAENTTLAVTDSGEKSFALQTEELQNFTQVGSNAAEYIKIVPGFGIQNGTSNKSNYNGQTIGINANGDSGSQSPLNSAFSYNGLPNNSLDIVADGAHVSDPGCNCDTPVNPNSDWLQEFKVLTSNFSAEEQKGPIVITSVTSAGGSTYHGGASFSARNHALNANDWLFNNSGTPQPANAYYYPEGHVGGPVPKLKNKLFFFTGFEYFYQTLDTGLLRATVPTASELGGDFSPASIAGEGNTTAANKPPGQLNGAAQSAFGGTTIPMCTGAANGKCIDPNMLALAKLYPKANADPNATGGYNYVQAEVFNQNNRQWTVRSDWNISDATKVFVRYNYQREVQQFPVGLWWRNGDQVPYPTAIEGKNRSDSVAGTITHVFNPSMTNETVVAYTFVGFPNVFADPNKVKPSTVGYGYKGLFGHVGSSVQQIPSFGNFGPSEAALVFNPGGFEAGGASSGLYANKYMPSASDTLTKVIGNHTVKVGLFWEWIRNAQPANNNTNGESLVSATSSTSYGNEYADLLTGNLNSYNETNFNRINDIAYTTWEFFGQDSFKATRKLTLEYGMRFSHFTPWIDRLGFGYSIFDPSAFSAGGAGCAGAPTFCGFEWHHKNSSVPVGGFPTKALFFQPRLGAAYDVHGNGRTVVRGGWGRFYYHSGQFTNGLDASAGVSTANLSPTNWKPAAGASCPANVVFGASPGHPGTPGLFAGNLSCVNLSATPASPAAVDSKDDNQPYTDSWSTTVEQATPWQGLFSVAYVGNRSRDLQNTAGGAGSNINLIPAGSFTGGNSGNGDTNLYRPYPGYGDINLATNNLYANYNGMVVQWARRGGNYTIQLNYTWQKALGIINPAANPFNLHANYAALNSDRRNLFNAAYSIDLGNRVHVNPFVNGALNGWQISGITQVESGPNLTYGGNFTPNNSPNLNYNLALGCAATAAEKAAGIDCATSGAIIPGSGSNESINGILPGNPGNPTPAGNPLNNKSIFGTSAQQLNPIVTCNPSSHNGAHQFVNASCFAAPATQAGPAMVPVSYGPAYFNWDLSVFKNFAITEKQKLQFRVQGYNFLNHPLWSFNGSNLTLQYQQDPVTQTFTQADTSFGKTTEKQGQRIVQLGVNYSF